MSDTPSLSAASSAPFPSGSRHGDWGWSSSTGTRRTISPVSAEARYKLRFFPRRAKNPMMSPVGEKSMERPATNDSLMASPSYSPVNPLVRFLITLPSRAESRTMSASPSARLPVKAAMTSPDGLAEKAKTWVYGVFSWLGERSLP
jgi:hypothetical protein